MSQKRKEQGESSKRELIERFFELLLDRKFAEAERTLEEYKASIKRMRGWSMGYLHALNGMMITLKSSGEGDKYALLSQILGKKINLKNCRKAISDHAKNKIHTEYDRGFFAAWLDFLRFTSKKML